MADTVGYNPHRAAVAALGLDTQEQRPFVPEVDFTGEGEEGPSVLDVAQATFMEETVIGAVVDHLREVSEGQAAPSQISDEIPDVNAPRPPAGDTFNQYAFYLDNKAGYEDMDFWVRKGYFDRVSTPREFEAKVGAIRRQLKNRQTMAEGGFLGGAAGMVVAFADLTTLVPIIGPLKKSHSAGRLTGFIAANAAGQTAAQELALQGLNDVRSPLESFLNIGVGTTIGGGLGALAAASVRGYKLHPGTEGNPFDPKASVPLEVRVPGESVNGGAPGVPQSVGAAAAGFSDQPFDVASGQTMNVLDRLSPVGAIVRTGSSEARMFAADLFDMPGVVTKQNEAGLPTQESAEVAFATTSLNHLRIMQEDIHEGFLALNGELGSTKNRAAIGLKEDFLRNTKWRNAVTNEEWNGALFRRLNDAEYKTGNVTIDKYLDQVAPKLRAGLDRLYEKGYQVGLFNNKKKIDDYLTQRWVSDKIEENPEAFDALLYEMWSTTPDEKFLADGWALTLDEFEKLPEGDPVRLEILQAWSSPKAEADHKAAVLRVKQAEHEVRQAHQRFVEESRAFRAAETAEKRATLAEARKTTTLVRERLRVAAEERENTARLYRTVNASIDAAQKKAADRADLADVLSAKHEDLRSARPVAIEGLQDLEGLAATAKAVPEPAPTLGRVKLEERAKTLARELHLHDAKVARLQKRLGDLETQVKDIEKLTENAEVLRAIAKSKKLAAERAEKVAIKAQKKAGAELRVIRERLSLGDSIHEIRQVLTNRQKTPYGILAEGTVQSARVKHRGIHIPKGFMDRFVAAGFLDTDVNGLMSAYTYDVGAKIALMEKFGTLQFDEALRARKVLEGFEERAATARAAGDTKKAAEILAEQKRVEKNLRAVWERHLGIYESPSDAAGWLMWISKTARYLNFTRYMGGAMISSLTDMATMSLNYGMGRSVAGLVGKPIAEFAKKMKDREVAALLFVGENGMLFSRAAKNMSLDELFAQRGVGTGWTRKGTAIVEGGLRWTVEKMNLVNGMSWWNSRLKFVAGQLQLQNIIEAAGRVGQLSEKEIREFARLGLSVDDVKEIAEHLGHHAEKNEYGLIDPNGEAWKQHSGAGANAHRNLLTALKRAIDLSVITPGHGDTPPFMSSAAGKAILQFQTFGFASVNRYMRHLEYKLTHDEWDALMSMTWGLAMGTTAYTIKEGIIKGRELPDPRNEPGTWVYEAIDRSGLMGPTMPFWNSGLKLAAPALKEAGVDWIDIPSRYRRASWLTAFLGPSYGLLEDVQKMGTALSNADLESVGTHAGKLVPYQNLFYVDYLWRKANGPED